MIHVEHKVEKLIVTVLQGSQIISKGSVIYIKEIDRHFLVKLSYKKKEKLILGLQPYL